MQFHSRCIERTSFECGIRTEWLGASSETGTPPIEERRYEDNFTFKYGKSFTKDPWTWGYTKEFAERFRMPEKWIEPQMKGILAMAFRVTDVGQSVTCGLGGREDNCWPNVRCQFDIYYDNSINLPWIKEAVTRDSFLTIPMSSARYTHNPYDQIANRYNSGLVGPFPLRIGFSDDKGFRGCTLPHFSITTANLHRALG